MKNQKYSPLFPLFLYTLLSTPYSLLPILPASAHKVTIAEDVGATLHIEPNDNPRAGEPAQAWFALTRKGGKALPLAECNCQLSVFSEPRKPEESALLQPSLKSVVAEKYQGIPGADITFPKPGAYQLQLVGKPIKGEGFKPFQFKFEVTVAAGTSQPLPTIANTSQVKNSQLQETATNSNSPPSIVFFLIGLSGTLVLGLIFAGLRRKRN
jgi:hypothetical protein